jgi:hypothetical protein
VDNPPSRSDHFDRVVYIVSAIGHSFGSDLYGTKCSRAIDRMASDAAGQRDYFRFRAQLRRCSVDDGIRGKESAPWCAGGYRKDAAGEQPERRKLGFCVGGFQVAVHRRRRPAPQSEVGPALARTNDAVAETGFPAYFIRLDPETKMSEVMILPRGDRGIVAAASN